ncbi:hypothetical protein [Mycolicibacterium palauense]|uniref:hypothetical protein n=1 Tax=Mycolicibacterium palauense TaxID=2034511 RepID=UPI001145F07C|nr:hypothetical protein [Mycolicibacterium palauense]
MSNHPYGMVPPGQQPWAQPSSLTSRGTSRWPVSVVGALAVLALAIAVVALFRPSPSPNTDLLTYSADQIENANQEMCDAHKKVSDTFAINDKRAAAYPPGDPNYLIVGLNSRILLLTGADYLLFVLDQNPATSKDMAEGTRRLASMWMNIVLDQIADTPLEDINKSFDQTKDIWKPILDGC